MENSIKATLSERIARSKYIESFRFLPETRIAFLPGQFTQLVFDSDNPGNRQLNKYLSFSASPTKQYLEVTKRLGESNFSQKLRNLKLGDSVSLRPAMGSCVFSDSDKDIAFLIGGIGITPVISILEYIVDKRLDTDSVVLYSNRTEDIAFRAELDDWQKLHKNIKVFYTLTDCEPKDKQCRFGAINQDLVKQIISDFSRRFLFIFGPPSMVEATYKLCLSLGCDQAKIKREGFIGY